jgi:hypothetical protein
MHNDNYLQNTRDCPLFNDVVLKLQSIQIAIYTYFQYTVFICLEERWISRSFKTAVPRATVACNSRELGGKHTPVPLYELQGGMYGKQSGTGAGFFPNTYVFYYQCHSTNF